MFEEEKERIISTLESVKYSPKLFTIVFGENSFVFGGKLIDQPEISKVFSYNSIYNSIIDTDRKIKLSILNAIEWVDKVSLKEWNPFSEPSENEWRAIYYTENAVFRNEMLWESLAQLFNLKYNLGKQPQKVNSLKLFCDAQQGGITSLFAKRVCEYMTQENDENSTPFRGNYSYIKDFRNKMTHRYLPTITSISEYATELRLPALYTLYRLSEDYKQVSAFISEILLEIKRDVEKSFQ